MKSPEEELNENPPSPYRFRLPVLNCKFVKSYYGDESQIIFHPLLHRQHYRFVRDLLVMKQDFGGINKVVDIGCSKLKLFPYLRMLDHMDEYVAVDIDKETLEKYGHRVRPTVKDRLWPRNTQLRAKVYHGSASEPDICLKNTNVIVAIHLIEHLYPETLEALVYNIFGIVQPEVAVFTTPNQDFNVLFKSPKKFRLFSHKFEWSRQQFQDWAENLVVRYKNYEKEISGIGPGPEGTEEHGCGTQVAVFFRKSASVEQSDAFQEIYKLIEDVVPPFKSTEDMIKDYAKIYIWGASKPKSYKKIKDGIEILLTDIHRFVTQKCECSEELLRTILVRDGWKVKRLDYRNYAVISPYHLVHEETSSEESSEGEEESLTNVDIEGSSNRPNPSSHIDPLKFPEPNLDEVDDNVLNYWQVE